MHVFFVSRWVLRTGHVRKASALAPWNEAGGERLEARPLVSLEECGMAKDKFAPTVFYGADRTSGLSCMGTTSPLCDTSKMCRARRRSSSGTID